MQWALRRRELTLYARQFDPAVRLLPHSHPLFYFLLLFLPWIPRGRFSITVGPCIGIPDEWTAARARRALPHEGAHVRQHRWLGLGLHPWLGLPLMFVFYGLLFLPIGIAYFRYRMELHAEESAWKVHLREGTYTETEVAERAQEFGATVASWAYLRPWPAPLVRRGFLRAAARVVRLHKLGRNW